MDILIIPDNLTLSAYISLFISVTLATPVILGENMLRTYCRKLEVSQALGVFKKLLSKGYIMLTVCITVNLWRGAWHLQTTLLLPGNPKLSALISHCVGFAGLMLCLVTRTLAGGADFEDSDIYEQCVTMYSMSCVKRFVEKFDSKVSAVPQDTDLQDFAGIGL
ncbi:uncharacterized protein LOC110462921 [Mizuhopecten yessoensis]|nr:uncharacterized protein LOC110462921 [Mizuhopecten yessoensis]